MTPQTLQGSPPSPEEIRNRVAERTREIPMEGMQTVPPTVFTSIDLAQYTAGAFLHRPKPELVWTFTDFLLTQNVALLAGPPGVGKSILSLQAGAAIAGGRGLEGILEPGVRGKVLVLAGEEDKRIIPARVEALRNVFYPDEDDARQQFDENFFIIPLAGETVRLIERDMAGGALGGTQVYHDLLTLCCRIPDLKMIIIDPLSRMYGLKEDDNSTATAFIILLEQLAKATGATVVLLHHTSKASTSRRQAKDDKEAYRHALEQEAARGASGFVGAVRAQMNLVGLTQKEAKVLFGDDDAQDNQYLAVAFPKINYGPPRPIVYLRRESGTGGILRVAETKQQTKTVQVQSSNEKILEWLIAKIRELKAGNLPGITKRTAEDLTPELRKTIPTATKAAVATTVCLALQDGRLLEVERRNARGRHVHYLAVAESTLSAPDTVHAVHTASEPSDSMGKAANS